jgi:hypothetical protein
MKNLSKQQIKKFIEKEFLDYYDTECLLFEIQDYFEWQPEWIFHNGYWLMI